MDVQTISAKLKAQLAGSTTAAGNTDSGTPVNAFAALLQTVGARFSTGTALGGLESKLMHSNDAAEAARADARADDALNAPRTAAKPKSSKSDNKDTKATSDDDQSDNTAASATQNDNTNAQTADQAQTTVQAVVAASVDVPVVSVAQVAPVAVVAQQVAATAAAAPVEAAVQATVATPEAQLAAAAAIAAPEQVAQAAPVVRQAAPAAVAQTSADDAPKLAQTFAAAAAAATDTSDDDTDQAQAAGPVLSTKTAAVKDASAGPKSVRSAAAVDQANTLAKTLAPDSKVDIQVQVTGRAQAATTADASIYDHYAGYTAGDTTSTANGQVGVADATNALVQAPKAAETQTLAVAPMVLPPQLQAQAPAPTVTARTDAAPIQALESASGGQSAEQSTQGEAGAGFESFHSTLGTQTTAPTSAASQTTASPQVTAQAVVDQIKVNITRAAKAGIDKVNIQLKPEALGRIDVKLEMSDDQKVRVTVTADNKDTLALLQNNSKSLEHALNDAGLRTDTANLHFSLREQSDQNTANQNASGQGAKTGGSSGTTDTTAADTTAPTYDYTEAARTRGGVDTFA